MRIELQRRLFEEFPSVFRYAAAGPDDVDVGVDGPDGVDPDNLKTEGMPPIAIDGIQCGDGWFQLVWNAARVLSQTETSDGEPVALVQVKQKFGTLRLYTGKRTPVAKGAIRMAEYQSKSTCELCGTPHPVEAVRTRRKIHPERTLCHACAMNERGITDGDDIEVWQFTMDCHECESPVEVVYPRGIGGAEGGSWACVGEQLTELDAGNVEETYSDVQETMVWGNCCPDCGTYQGNYYVYRTAQNHSRVEWAEKDGEFEQVATVTADLQ